MTMLPATRIHHAPLPRIPDDEWWADHRRTLAMSDLDKTQQTLESLAFCPQCNRVVVVVHTFSDTGEKVLADPLPKDRAAIVQYLGNRFTAFGKRSPMRSLIGEWIRPAHDCKSPTAEPHPKRGWKPVDAHQADIYDMG
jgi:hypothetical protein